VRLPLRWKILLFTVVPLAALGIATLWVLHGTLSRQVHGNVREELTRAAAVFENMLAARAEELAVAGQVIVQDPKFFAVLTLPAAESDPQFRATVGGVARDFNAITHADVFEVLNQGGRRVASVGADATSEHGRSALVKQALQGELVSGIVVEPQAHYQAIVTPIVAGRRVVGALVLGKRIGQELAERLRSLTRSEVTFLSAGQVTGSTLAHGADRGGLVSALGTRPAESFSARSEVFELNVQRDTYVTLARHIPATSPAQRQLYVMQRSLNVETEFLRQIRTHLIELGLVAGILVLTAGFLIARSITSPVQTLVRGAAEMERGNYDFPMEVRSRDEIGYLAARFKEMRRQQRVYVKSLEEVARMKSEFISVASHELRTPISIISGFQELMRDGRLGPLTEQQRDAVQAIGRSVGTLLRIAEDATRIAQVENERMILDRREHRVAYLLDEAVADALSHAPGRRVPVTIEVSSDLGSVRLDGPRFAQAVSQLVRNGIRFTPDGGRVTVRGRRDDDELVIEVRDTGVGIPREKLGQVFERSLIIRDSLHHHSSTTLEFNSAGLGLGLPIARGIVEAHGGTLSVESEPGRGSVFLIRVRLHVEMLLERAA
jgi:signal transduction histidine kinase